MSLCARLVWLHICDDKAEPSTAPPSFQQLISEVSVRTLLLLSSFQGDPALYSSAPRKNSIFWEVVRQAFFPIAHSDNLLITQTQPHLITLLFCGRLEQGSTIKSSVFILAIHCLHTLSHTHPIQLRLLFHYLTLVMCLLIDFFLYFLHFWTTKNKLHSARVTKNNCILHAISWWQRYFIPQIDSRF